MELRARDTQSTLTVSDATFGREFNEPLVHQVVVAYAASGRQGSKKQKSRGEVVGSGKKPWRQKGTGRARAGSVQSPIWRSGGVTFAARPQDHSQKVNRKMYRGAISSIFSECLRQNRLILLENFSVDTPKTKGLIAKLEKFELTEALIITSEVDENLFLAARNLPKVDVRDCHTIDPVSLIRFDKVVITINALKQIEGMLG